MVCLFFEPQVVSITFYFYLVLIFFNFLVDINNPCDKLVIVDEDCPSLLILDN